MVSTYLAHGAPTVPHTQDLLANARPIMPPKLSPRSVVIVASARYQRQSCRTLAKICRASIYMLHDTYWYLGSSALVSRTCRWLDVKSAFDIVPQ
jgi:hypothetical protein